MIDEAHHQQAADELRSERRDLTVWSRACALADGDHDEARYLYTSLRAATLATEYRALDAPDAARTEPTAFTEPSRLNDTSPTAIALDDSAIHDTDTHESLSGDLSPRQEVSSFGRGGLVMREPDESTAARRAAARGLITSPDNPTVVGQPRRHEDGMLANDFDTFPELDDTEPTPPPRDGPRSTVLRTQGPSNDIDYLDGLPEPATDTLVAELERQARELSLERDVSARLDERLSLPPPSSTSERPAASGAARGARQRGTDEYHRAAGRGHDIARGRGGDGPLELDAGGRRKYAVFRRKNSRSRSRWQTVRQGGSIGALLITLPWLLYRRMIGTAIFYTLFAVVVLAGLAVTASIWYEAGEAVTESTRAAAITFATLGFLGLFIAPWRLGNHWREDKLETRGFELIAYVRARNRRQALATTEKAIRATRSRTR